LLSCLMHRHDEIDEEISPALIATIKRRELEVEEGKVVSDLKNHPYLGLFKSQGRMQDFEPKSAAELVTFLTFSKWFSWVQESH